MKRDLKKTNGLFVQILIVLVLFSIAVYSLWRINLIKFPDFIENIISPDNASTGEYAGDGYEIFKYISDASSVAESIYPEISLENLSDTLISLEAYDNFYWESTAKVYSDFGSSSKTCRSRISGNRYNIELLDADGNTLKKYISDGKKSIVSKYNGNNVVSSVYTSGLMDFYSDSGIISVSDISNTDFDKSSCEIRRIEKDGFNLISIVYSYNRNDVTVKNNVLLSLDYGVVLFAEIHENNKLVYTLDTKTIYQLESLDDELFIVS